MPDFTARCGKSFDRASRVKLHERMCQQCRELAASTEAHTVPSVVETRVGEVIPPSPRCKRCDGPLQANELETGICSVCHNEMVAKAEVEEPAEAKTPAQAPATNVDSLTAKLNEITTAVNKLAENQKIMYDGFVVLQPVIDTLKAKRQESGAGPAAAGDGKGNGHAPTALAVAPGDTDQGQGGLLDSLIARVLPLLFKTGPQLSQPNAQFDMFEKIMGMVSEHTQNQIAIFRSGSDFASGLISVANKNGAEPGNAADILRSKQDQILPPRKREPNK